MRTNLFKSNVVRRLAAVLPLLGAAAFGANAFALQIIGVNNANSLVRFDSSAPGAAQSVSVTGLGANETLVGIDYRPANGQLYGLTKDLVSIGRLYVINPDTGAATLGSTLAADPADLTAPYTLLTGTNYGLDFNPVPDRLRVVSDSNQNLRINVANGLVTTDGDLNPGGSVVGGSAYDSSVAGTTSTTLYGIDSAGDRLVIQTPPNNGTLVGVGSGFGIDVTGVGGFDIISTGKTPTGPYTNTAFAALTVAGTTRLYTVDLNAGTITSVGAVGNGSTSLVGLAIKAPVPNDFIQSLLEKAYADFAYYQGQGKTNLALAAYYDSLALYLYYFRLTHDDDAVGYLEFYAYKGKSLKFFFISQGNPRRGRYFENLNLALGFRAYYTVLGDKTKARAVYLRYLKIAARFR